MSQPYDKKINTSLTSTDFDFVVDAAHNDRRTPAQYASILLENAIAAERANKQPKVQTND